MKGETSLEDDFSIDLSFFWPQGDDICFFGCLVNFFGLSFFLCFLDTSSSPTSSSVTSDPVVYSSSSENNDCCFSCRVQFFRDKKAFSSPLLGPHGVFGSSIISQSVPLSSERATPESLEQRRWFYGEMFQFNYYLFFVNVSIISFRNVILENHVNIYTSFFWGEVTSVVHRADS